MSDINDIGKVDRTDESYSPLFFIHRWTPKPGIPNQISFDSFLPAINGDIEWIDTVVLKLNFCDVDNVDYKLEIDNNRRLIIRYTIIKDDGSEGFKTVTTYNYTYDDLDRLTSTSIEWHNMCDYETEGVHRDVFIYKYAPDGSFITKGPY